MVLVDTSVWIRFLADRAPHAGQLAWLLEHEEAAGHEMVFGELLIGDIGGRTKLLASYEMLDQAKPVPHSEVVEFVRARKLHGRGAGWIDIHLLASAVAGGHKLFAADARLEKMAAELGVAYTEPMRVQSPKASA